MITRPAAFRVFGEPAPKGSLAGRCLTHPKIGALCYQAQRVVMSESANRARPWRRAIEKAAPVHIAERADPHQPLMVSALFAVTRTPAAAGRVAPSTQSAQGVGGDLDKMVRLLLDALESCGVLHNDAQVTRFGDLGKVFADDGEWVQGVDRRRGVPGLYCRVEPVGWVPDALPYEAGDDSERTDQ